MERAIASPSPIPLCLVLKNESNTFWYVFHRNAVTVVTHGDHDRGTLVPHRDFDESPILWQTRHRIHRVKREIGERLLNLYLIPLDDGRRP
jgi:hypothetical protein